MKLLITELRSARLQNFCFLSAKQNRRQKGFTLTEVVLALGIIAFAFLPVLGLLPLGLDTSRQAVDTTIESQIVQGLSSKALQSDFSNLDTMTNSYFYDYQGNNTSADKAIYKVGCAITTSTELPSANTSLGTSSKLKTVTICILNTKTRNFAQETDPVKNTAAKKYAFLIADNGR